MANPAPQPPVPEPPGKPAPPPADQPPPDPVAANPKPAEEGALFRALVDAGMEATLAYTVEKRMHAMTTETVAAQIQPVLAELREMRESMVTKADLAEFATKADLAEFVTKADLAEFATKADLAEFVTKADLAKFGTQFVTKGGLGRVRHPFRHEGGLVKPGNAHGPMDVRSADGPRGAHRRPRRRFHERDAVTPAAA